MVGGNARNQCRQYNGHNAENQIGYNARQIAGNQNGYNAIRNNGNGNVIAARAEGNGNGNNGNQIRCYNFKGLGHYARNCTVKPKRRDVAHLQTQLLIAQKEEAEDIDKIEKVNENCILMANLKQASTSGTQIDKDPVYDSNGSVEYTELFEPVTKLHPVQQNTSYVIIAEPSLEHNKGTVEQHPATIEETHA
nr:hypothetical protein [Tanacetum cinerariifolium]